MDTLRCGYVHVTARSHAISYCILAQNLTCLPGLIFGRLLGWCIMWLPRLRLFSPCINAIRTECCIRDTSYKECVIVEYLIQHPSTTLKADVEEAISDPVALTFGKSDGSPTGSYLSRALVMATFRNPVAAFCYIYNCPIGS
ncbi:hypothetical protein BD779DRAFT_1531668 [Infundibulicybe gibba]|nr:hypothetical protein BD779DRAFT_1531668 [Infundibulicybe gibba]